MASLLARGQRLYAKVKDINGKWPRVRTPFVKGQEALAQKWADDLEADVERMLRGEPVAAGAPLTLTAWVEKWGATRRELGVDGNNDYNRLRLHVLPRIGHMPIGGIEPQHLVEVVHKIRTTPIKTPRGMTPPAIRTVHNVYSALCAMFRDAQLAGKVTVSPCVLTEYQLGVKVDVTPGWRNAAVFDRPEAQTMISTPKIPWDRRVTYAIELLTGLRPGEGSALRLRHYDPKLKPLGGLFIGEALNSKRGTTKRTKTDSEKWVPVHPTLAAILAEWLLSGWAEMMGRAPTPDDLLVPLPPADAEARTKRRDSEPFRTTYYSARRWLEEDIPALGWRYRRHYDTRATFITLALEDGADLDVIERRITHTKKSRSAFDGYNRGKQWAATCAELVKLQIVRVRDGEEDHVQRLDVAVNGPTVVQPEIIAAMSASSELRRRGSNPIRLVRDSDGRQSEREVAGQTASPDPAGDGPLDQTVVQGPITRCDAGLALLRASAVGPDE